MVPSAISCLLSKGDDVFEQLQEVPGSFVELLGKFELIGGIAEKLLC